MGTHTHTHKRTRRNAVCVCVCVGWGRKLSPLMGPPHCSPIMPQLFQDTLRANPISGVWFYDLKSFLIFFFSPSKTDASRYKLSAHKFTQTLHTVCNQVSSGGLDLGSVTLPSVSSLQVGGGKEAPAAQWYLGK